jgi:UDP-glucose 4-epimerase
VRFLITGGAGYFGSVLKKYLLAAGHTCVSIDILNDIDQHANLESHVLDITDQNELASFFAKQGNFDAIYHCAAQLILKRRTRQYFNDTNVTATRYLADLSVKHNVKHFIFISSNCVYGKLNQLLVQENHPLNAFELYGQGKVKSEIILQNYTDKMNVIIFRPPTIIGKGRLGILSLVYDFIREHKKLWLVGKGENRYQFILGEDLARACLLAVQINKSHVFNIGTDNVPTLNTVFTDLINYAKSRTKIIHFPEKLGIGSLKLAYHLGISPLGPYSYNMIASSYIGDTTKIKNELNWEPTKSNSEILIDGYQYYLDHYHVIHNKTAKLPGHRSAGRVSILNAVKWIS